ncbi:MAG: hypothetical protein IJX92_05200 [Clostridia bacterium]|nr:hypothetical protein [Clostridia bacterium]
MVNFKIRLANRLIGVECLYESTAEFCREYLSSEGESDFSVAVSMTDILEERAKSDRERELEGLPPYIPSPTYLETLALYRKIAERLVDYDTILFHGSAIAVDGVAYIFTAKSGTGKSTHTRLWREAFGERAVMVNDDKPLIKISDGEVTVYGTPWNGKHNLGSNISAPLAAIVSLERGENNRILAVDKKYLLPKIFSQTYRAVSPIALSKTLGLIDKMLDKVSLYELYCNMNPDAATVAYEGMRGNKK